MYGNSNPKLRPPHRGEIEFQLLCPTEAAGGLIGHAGHVVKSLERETSCYITVDLAVSPSSKERLVHVIGSTSISRTLNFNDRDLHVSAAQEGLFRVFERVLESEVASSSSSSELGRSGRVKCRMLVGPGVAGGLIGPCRERINKIMRETEAHIRIWRSDVLDFPNCADPTHELIQMTGDSIAVKKALLVVSRHMVNKLYKRTELKAMPKPKPRIIPKNNVVNGGGGGGGGGDVAKVRFKLLCPYGVSGWIIGAKGKGVKDLQQETGASIFFFPLGDGCDDRVTVVFASEHRKSQFSCAQNAVVRIFSEVFPSEEISTVTARLIIMPNQSNWLRSGEISILSAIESATGATLKIVELDCSYVGVSADEQVLQIYGDKPSVQVALFRVTWKLRERTFEMMLPKTNIPVLPHKLLNGASKCNKIAALTDDMNSCRVSEEFSSTQCSSTSSESSRDLATVYGGSGFGSGSESAIVTKTMFEIAVREDVFGAVYGDNGSNLARLRQISGATVEVHDPCPGSEGKVIISGTRDQTMVAQSLLQAFLMSNE